MVGEDTDPPTLRASDEDRDKAVDLLRQETVLGRLSADTFLQRMDVALRARSRGELAAVLHDLPPARRRGDWLVRTVGWCAGLGARLSRVWHGPQLPALTLPRGDRVFVIGRSPDCDLALANMTVSWQHAELRRFQEQWVLVDLNSTNGTHVNGWRAGPGLFVRPGDQVRFGNAVYRIVD